MIRKFNYTGRKKIARRRVRIELFRDGEGRRRFNLQLGLDGLLLPDSARVYVEAYHRTAYQRFDWGRVGALSPPADRRLWRFGDNTVPLFRVKVVDRSGAYGRILAAADKLRPEGAAGLPAGSQSLLFVEYEALGNTVWQLDLEGDWPLLKLNREVEEISLVASSDSRFLALVYPEVLRQILARVLVEDQHTDPDCDDDWPSLWLKLACSLPGMPPPPAAGRPAQQAWIEKAVDAFSADHRLLEKFNRSLKEAK